MSTVFCPCCGKPLRLMETMGTYSECDRDRGISICSCGVFDVILQNEKIAAVSRQGMDGLSLCRYPVAYKPTERR